MLFDAFGMFCMLLLIVLLMLLFAPVPAESALGRKTTPGTYFSCHSEGDGAAKRPTRPKMFDLYWESEKHKIPKRP